jgi:hypothetical protein
MLRYITIALLAVQPPAPPRDVATPSQSPERYVIRGRVTDVATGQPLRGVAISIRSSGEVEGLARGALTDDEGRWSFAQLPAGDYVLNHSKPGFTRVHGVRIYSPVHVSPQFPVRDLELVLARGGVISGRVTDPMGEPAVQVQVQAHRVLQGQPWWPQHHDTTDDRGEFRLFGLMPGEYAVSATPQRGHDSTQFSEGRQSPVMTYYPGTVQAAEAERLVIAEQGAVSDLTFQLQTARTFVISGQVVSSSSHVTDGFVSLDQDGSSRGSPVEWGRSGGRFRIAEVLPGEYTVSAHVRLENGEEHGEAPVVVGDADVTVTIVTRGPTVVRGRVVPLSGPLRDLDGLMIGAWSVAPQQRSSGRPGRVKEDGTFEATTTAASPFRVALVNRGAMGTGWRQKEVRWRGERVGKEGITASGPVVEGVEVVIVAATARLQGTARDATGGAMREGTVVLVAAEDVAEDFPMWHRAVLTDGRFVSPPVPEGRYLVAAVPAVAPGQITPDVVAQVRERGESVELGDRELRTIALTAVVDAPR